MINNMLDKKGVKFERVSDPCSHSGLKYVCGGGVNFKYTIHAYFPDI